MSIVPYFMCAGLARIQTQFPEAVIVGGALRDTYFGRSIKDVDVFVTHIESVDGRDFVWEKLRAAFPKEYDNDNFDIFDCRVAVSDYPNVRLVVPDARDYEDWSDGDVRSVYEVQIEEGQVPFQIITTNKPMSRDDVMMRVDFDFCRTAFDGRLWDFAPSFYEAGQRKTATYVGSSDPKQMGRSCRRGERLHDKYPDWTFDIGDRIIFPVPKWQDFAI